MERIRPQKRRIGTNHFAAIMPAQANTLLVPANPKRCGLIISGNGNQAWITMKGEDASIESNAYFVVGVSRTPLYLGPELDLGESTEDIRTCCTTAAAVSVYATEFFYLDDPGMGE